MTYQEASFIAYILVAGATFALADFIWLSVMRKFFDKHHLHVENPIISWKYIGYAFVYLGLGFSSFFLLSFRRIDDPIYGPGVVMIGIAVLTRLVAWFASYGDLSPIADEYECLRRNDGYSGNNDSGAHPWIAKCIDTIGFSAIAFTIETVSVLLLQS